MKTLERPRILTPKGLVAPARGLAIPTEGIAVMDGRDATVYVGAGVADRAVDRLKVARRKWRRGMRPLPEICGGAVSAKWYGQAIMQAFGSGSSGGAPNIDFLSDSMKVMLTTSTYVPDQDAHVFKSDVTNEISGTGYSAGGTALATKTLGYTSGTNVIKFDADDTAWASSTLVARIAPLYDATPSTDATRPLMIYVDFGADVSTTNGTLTIVWDSAGICTITPA
jgi:hypothetical protein